MESAEVDNSENNFNNISQLMLVGLLFFSVNIGGNYIEDTFGCKYIELFKSSIVIKHLIGLLFMFIAGIVSVQSGSIHPIKLVLYALFAYIIYISITRTKYPNGLIIFGILIVIFLIGLMKNYKSNIYQKQVYDSKLKKIKNKVNNITDNQTQTIINDIINIVDNRETYTNSDINKIGTIQKIITIIVIIMTIIMTSTYIYGKYNKYNDTDQFSWITLFLGNDQCKTN